MFIAGPQQPAHTAAPNGNDAAGSEPSPDPGACGCSPLSRSDTEIASFVSDAFYPSGRRARLKGYMPGDAHRPRGAWLKRVGGHVACP